jgi:hypothetical protein
MSVLLLHTPLLVRIGNVEQWLLREPMLDLPRLPFRRRCERRRNGEGLLSRSATIEFGDEVFDAV